MERQGRLKVSKEIEQFHCSIGCVPAVSLTSRRHCTEVPARLQEGVDTIISAAKAIRNDRQGDA